MYFLLNKGLQNKIIKLFLLSKTFNLFRAKTNDAENSMFTECLFENRIVYVSEHLTSLHTLYERFKAEFVEFLC